jgi:hypothetical protein
MEIHPLLNTASNVKRAGKYSIDSLIAAHLDHRSRMPRDKAQYTFRHSGSHSVYICKTPRNDSYFVSKDGCTCTSWTEQLSLKKWLKSEVNTDFTPICKHQVMLESHLANSPRLDACNIIWDVVAKEIVTWKSRDNKTFTEHKTIPVSQFNEVRIKCLTSGWGFIRRHEGGLSRLFATSRR